MLPPWPHHATLMAAGVHPQQAEVAGEVSAALPPTGLPAVPVVEVHYGLQRVPTTRRNVSFKPRQQRDHHVHSETLVFPETIVRGNISPKMLQLRTRGSPLGFTFPGLTILGFHPGLLHKLRQQSVRCISSFRFLSPVTSTSASTQTFRRRRNNFPLADDKRS